jgi:gluconate 2-dehydrogenase subunit 3-like protein
VPHFLSDHEQDVLSSAADRLLPPQDAHPGGAALGVVEYVDRLLAAFSFDPPLVFAGGPFSGRFGGEASFARFLPLSPREELAWRTRIEGSQGRPEREFNGPVRGWQQIYREGIAGLGADFTAVDSDEQDRRLAAQREFRNVFYAHACEGAYGAPEYGGNKDLEGWRVIGFDGDVQPRGYTDGEVTGRD